MKGPRHTVAFATVFLALPLFAYSQNSSSPTAGSHEAALMKPGNATLVHSLDSRKAQAGETVDAKLEQKVTLTNGTKLPSGTMLMGKVTADDMQEQGMSKLALRFDQARLKDGTTLPVRASIVGFYPADTADAEVSPTQDGHVPNDWSARTLQLDQENVVPGVDLHSKIASHNSGVFVSTKKDDVKLHAGSEIQFALAPANNSGMTSGS
jgi:hypothetical protein